MLQTNRTLLLLLGLCILASCRKSRKDDPLIPYQYQSLNDTEVKYLKPFFLDMDKDGNGDFYFTIALINDAAGVHAKFVAGGIEAAKVLAEEDSVIKLEKDAPIPLIPGSFQEWSSVSAYICEILLPAADPQDTTWTGSWVAANRRYMGVQFKKDEEPIMGWISLSVDTANDRLVLHECAWRPLKAGPAKAGAR